MKCECNKSTNDPNCNPMNKTNPHKKASDYYVLHNWLKYNCVKRTYCDFCGLVKKRIEFALKKGKEYSKVAEDYFHLCVSCHRKYDYGEGHRKAAIKKAIIMGEKNRKAIKQFNNKGDLLKEWESASEASRKLPLDRTHIGKHLRGEKMPDCHKFIFA